MFNAIRKALGTYGPLTDKEKDNRPWLKGPRGQTMDNPKPGGHSRYFLDDVPPEDLATCKAVLKLSRQYIGKGDVFTLQDVATPEFVNTYEHETKARDAANIFQVIEDVQPIRPYELEEGWQEGERYYLVLRVKWKETAYLIDKRKSNSDPTRIVSGSDMRWEDMDCLVTFACDVNGKYPYNWKVHKMLPVTK